MMRRLKTSLFLSVLIALFLVAACAPSSTPTPTPAPTPTPTPKPAPTPESSADFYKKNTVELVVTTSAATGVDYDARVLASFWSDVTGGTIKVVNKPGAAHVSGSNYIYTVAKADGLTIGYSTGSIIEAVRKNAPGVEYDLTKIQYIAYYCKGLASALVVGPNSPYKTVAELQKAKGLKLGLQGETSFYAPAAGIAITLLNLDAKIIAGFKSNADIWLALARGEIDIMIMSYSDLAELTAKKMIGPVLSTITYERPDYWKDVPSIAELGNLTPEQRRLLDVDIKYRVSGQFIWVRPEVSQDKVKYLRDVFTKIAANKDAIKLWEKDIVVWTEPSVGEDARKVVLTALAAPKEDILKLSQIVQDLASK